MSSIDRVTVMFARASGSPELTQRIGAETAHDRLLTYQERLRELVDEYNGELGTDG